MAAKMERVLYFCRIKETLIKRADNRPMKKCLYLPGKIILQFLQDNEGE